MHFIQNKKKEDYIWSIYISNSKKMDYMDKYELKIKKNFLYIDLSCTLITFDLSDLSKIPNNITFNSPFQF